MCCTGQDIFGVDFDYDDFEKYGDEEYESESEGEDEYEEDGEGEREKRPKKAAKKKPTRKSIFEIYEPSELKRGHFTDIDNEVISIAHVAFVWAKIELSSLTWISSTKLSDS